MEAEGPVVEDAEICDNWEQIEENSEVIRAHGNGHNCISNLAIWRLLP
jgi:hypothetical protein